MLKERTNALQHETLGPIDLGNAVAAPTENTEYIIAQKDRAVPLLIEALKEDGKPVQVGYAAYCLRRIGSDKGKEVAAAAHEKLSKRGEEIRIEERFARTELKNYLESIGAYSSYDDSGKGDTCGEEVSGLRSCIWLDSQTFGNKQEVLVHYKIQNVSDGEIVLWQAASGPITQ
jgi:hypothetical protein